MCQVYIYFSIHIIFLHVSGVVPLLDFWLEMGSVEISYVAPLLVHVSTIFMFVAGLCRGPSCEPCVSLLYDWILSLIFNWFPLRQYG